MPKIPENFPYAEWLNARLSGNLWPTAIESIRRWFLLALALGLAGVFLKFAHNVLYDSDDRSWIQNWDNIILLTIANFRSVTLTATMIDITALGSITLIGMIAAVFFVAFYLLRDFAGIVQLALAAVGAGFWTWIFKDFAERPRPTIIPQLVYVSGYSFPSGHSLAAAALYFTFATMAAKHFKSWKHALALQFLAALVISCVAISRVYLGVHYPSDVLSGALFGTAWAYFVAGAIALKGTKNHRINE